MSSINYWKETVQEAANTCGLIMTADQLDAIAGAVQVSHECYGLAYYEPPPSDRYAEIEREAKRKVSVAVEEKEQIRADFIQNICMRHKCDPSDVVLDGNGHATILR